MRRASVDIATGLGQLAMGAVAAAWLLCHRWQWRTREQWFGRYDQPVDPWAEGDELAQNAEAGAHLEEAA